MPGKRKRKKNFRGGGERGGALSRSRRTPLLFLRKNYQREIEEKEGPSRRRKKKKKNGRVSIRKACRFRKKGSFTEREGAQKFKGQKEGRPICRKKKKNPRLRARQKRPAGLSGWDDSG